MGSPLTESENQQIMHTNKVLTVFISQNHIKLPVVYHSLLYTFTMQTILLFNYHNTLHHVKLTVVRPGIK
jgi:hypothetical protein